MDIYAKNTAHHKLLILELPKYDAYSSPFALENI